jgi:hypothetical protein
MAYSATKPDSTDAMSASQATLKDNFTAIKALVDVNHVTFGLSDQGKHNIVTIPQITVVPATTPVAVAATEWAFYVNAATSDLFLRHDKGAGTVTGDYNLTGATKASPGECTLPCGIRLKWGTGSIGVGSSSSTGSYVGTALTNFHNITFSISTTYTSTKDNRDYHLAMTGTTAGWTVTRSGSYNGAAIDFYYLAIGD